MKNLKDYIVNENNFFKNLGVGQIKLIKEWLDEHKITNYTINSDLTIDVNGTVDLSGYEEKQLPYYIQFGEVTKYFYIYNCSKLESLKECPKEVGGNFYCNDCPNLESLEGAPQSVSGDFWCRFCGAWFAKEDVKKVCKVKGKIHV